MPKYLVRVFSPTVYELEAESGQVAKQKAVERYKKEEEKWIDPEIVEVSEIRKPKAS
jgi:hypothetical protein